MEAGGRKRKGRISGGHTETGSLQNTTCNSSPISEMWGLGMRDGLGRAHHHFKLGVGKLACSSRSRSSSHIGSE